MSLLNKISTLMQSESEKKFNELSIKIAINKQIHKGELPFSTYLEIFATQGGMEKMANINSRYNDDKFLQPTYGFFNESMQIILSAIQNVDEILWADQTALLSNIQEYEIFNNEIINHINVLSLGFILGVDLKRQFLKQIGTGNEFLLTNKEFLISYYNFMGLLLRLQKLILSIPLKDSDIYNLLNKNKDLPEDFVDEWLGILFERGVNNYPVKDLNEIEYDDEILKIWKGVIKTHSLNIGE